MSGDPTNQTSSRMKAARYLVGVIHLPALPGSPLAKLGLREIADAAAQDARILVDAGYTHCVMENFGDAPFFRGQVPPITCAAMTAIAVRVRAELGALPLGINVLRNDAQTALAVAVAAAAEFVRVNIHVGARVTDQGVIEGDAAGTLRARRMLAADAVQIWADVDVKHSAPLAPYDLGQETRDALARGLASCILVTGEGTGRSAPLDKLARVKAAAGESPVLLASGASIAALPDLLGVCDGVIVGSALRASGVAGGRIDARAASEFAHAFASVR